MAAESKTSALLGITGPPEEVSEVAAQFVPRGTPAIVNMELERKAVELSMVEGIPTILVGHTGIAKTRLLQRVHEELGWPYRHINGRESLEADNLLGRWLLKDGETVFRLGILPFCMKNGIALGIQEINYVAPEVLVLLHEYVDEGFVTLDELDPEHEDFVIRPHPNFRLYGTMNPPELYPGARDLSPALVRRCIVRRVDVLGPEDEKRVILEQQPHVDEVTAEQMVEVAGAVRSQFDSQQSSFWLSTADLVMWARISKHMPPLEAGEVAILGKTQTDEDFTFVRGRIRLSFEPGYTQNDIDGSDMGF